MTPKTRYIYNIIIYIPSFRPKFSASPKIIYIPDYIYTGTPLYWTDFNLFRCFEKLNIYTFILCCQIRCSTTTSVSTNGKPVVCMEYCSNPVIWLSSFCMERCLQRHRMVRKLCFGRFAMILMCAERPFCSSGTDLIYPNQSLMDPVLGYSFN